MPALIDQLKQDIATLPDEQRAEIARFVIDSLEPIEPEEEVAAAWREELRRREEEIRSGAVQGIPAEEVFARLDEKYR